MVDIAAAMAACAWLYLALLHGRFWRVRPLLMPPPPLTSNDARVAVVIPARNEQASIGRTVASLAAQDWPGPLHIWVVDDGSIDTTAELARETGRDKVTVSHAPPLPAGWTGKMWALSHGIEQALRYKPNYLLFTDADIEHARDSIRGLVARAEAGGFDIVSVMVKLHCSSPAERLLIPAFVFFFFMLYPPAWRAGAAGGCILIRPEALRRIGGIDVLRGELIDDCALAAAVRRSGGSRWLGLSNDTCSIRPYPRFADIRQMIARTAFTQLRYSTILLTGTVAGMCLLYVLPVVAALRGSPFGIATWVLMTAVYLPMVRFYGQPAWTAALLPLAGVFYTFATVESALLYWAGRGGTWKGRHQAA
jgi:hopene-associated glycosyltransferase HpnB